MRVLVEFSSPFYKGYKIMTLSKKIQDFNLSESKV